MATFSERNGYVQPNDVIIKGTITQPIINSIYNCFWKLRQNCWNVYHNAERQVWVYFLNEKEHYFDVQHTRAQNIILSYLEDNVPWYKKLDLIEFVLPLFRQELPEKVCNNAVNFLNAEFERHNFAYRIIENIIVEVTSNDEIRAIETAMDNTVKGIKIHIKAALEELSVSTENPNYRNSIKESISAVEACCRYITKESTLGKALSKLESKGIVINSQMKKGFENLYHYTNDEKTGIRHSLMDDANTPTSDDAIFMLVSCSAFINYLTKKSITIE